MAEPFLGEIRAFGFNFAPRGWAECNGQLLAISSNTALFSLLGTTYGGDGRTTFALPDLRGRSAMHQGTGPGLQRKQMGQRGGVESTQLTTANLPPHSHTASFRVADEDIATTTKAKNKALAQNANIEIYSKNPTFNEGNTMTPEVISINNTGLGQAFSSQSPYLTVNICIALQGLFPSRS